MPDAGSTVRSDVLKKLSIRDNGRWVAPAVWNLHEDTLILVEEECVSLMHNLLADASEDFKRLETISKTVGCGLWETVEPIVSTPTLQVDTVVGQIVVEVCVGFKFQDVGVDDVAYLAGEGGKRGTSRI
jgi:hypothetical protein